MKTSIFIGGIYNVVFALFHTAFWKLWKWDSELSKLDIVNSGIMQILNIQIIYYFLLTAVICFAFPTQLGTTKLGKCFLIGTAGFWFIRTIQQIIFLRLNGPVFWILVIIFLFGTIIFLIPVFYKKRIN